MRRSLLVASKDDVRKRTDPRAGVGRVGLSGRYGFSSKSNGGLSPAWTSADKPLVSALAYLSGIDDLLRLRHADLLAHGDCGISSPGFMNRPVLTDTLYEAAGSPAP